MTIGYCVPCVSPRCRLPPVLTVTFSGLSNVTRSGPLLPLIRAVDPRLVAFTRPDVTAYAVSDTAEAVVSDITVLGSVDPLPWYAFYGRAEPTLTATNNTGHGATFTPTIEKSTDSHGFSIWQVKSVAVGGDGYGYTNNSAVVLTVSELDTCQQQAVATLKAARAQPTLSTSISVDSCKCGTTGLIAGTGAKLSVSYTQTSSTANQETWAVSGVTVESGGSNYHDGAAVSFGLGPGDVQASAASATIVASGGIISSVNLTSGGSYYKQGVPQSVTVASEARGRYFREDKTLPPLSPPVFAGFFGPAIPTNSGTAPTFTATVDDKLSSTTFGEVTGISVASGTATYKHWEAVDMSCLSKLNGVPVVLTATDGHPNGNDYTVWGPQHRAVTLCAESSFGVPPTLAVDDAPPGFAFTGYLDGVADASYDYLETGINQVFIRSPGSGLAALARIEPVCKIAALDAGGAEYVLEWSPAFSLRTGVNADLSRGLPSWQLQKVRITHGGSGFASSDGALLQLSGATVNDKGLHDRLMYLYRKRVQPTASVSTPCHSGNAKFEVEWIKDLGDVPTWGVGSVKIVQGGTGYQGRVLLQFTATSGSTQGEAACAYGITNDAGVIVSVEVLRKGKYFKRTDQAGYVLIDNMPAWYRETTSLPVLVADVPVFIRQLPPSHGSGADVSVTIDTDPDSPTFGQATAATVVSSGADYILYRANYTDFSNYCDTFNPDLRLSVEANLIYNEKMDSCVFSVTLIADNFYGGARASANFDDDLRLVFAAERGSEESLNTSNRSITLSAIQPGVNATATLEWGGVIDLDATLCGCCDIDPAKCGEPAVSGWPVGEGQDPLLYTDPMGLVFPRTCDGVNQNGDFVFPNGGPILWEATFDENDDFAGWSLLCGPCAEPIQVGVDNNGDPIYSDQPEPGFSPGVRSDKGLTVCKCFPTNLTTETETRCVWRPTVVDGCWNGEYSLESSSCENPLP